MALSDLAKGGGGATDKAPAAVAVTVHAAPLDPVVAAGRVLKAIKAGDAEAFYDAFCLMQEAHADRLDKAKASDDDDGDEY